MGRRTILLIAAALVAVLGAGMVFLYVQGVSSREADKYNPVEVLKAVAQIEPGETLAAAQSAGKLELQEVPQSQVLDGAMNAVGESGGLVALARVFPNEQITTAKFGTAGEQDVLAIPDGDFAISVNLSDTGRVAGFVSPGSKVAIFLNGPVGQNGEDGSRLLLPSVQVIAVGATTVSTATTTDQTGTQTTEQLPKTLFTLSVNQATAQKILFASTHGELSFGLLNDKSKVAPAPAVTQQNLFG